MKNLMRFTILIPVFLVACANDASKVPVQDLEQIRTQSQQQMNNGPKAPEAKIEYVPRDVPVIQEKTVYVPKEVPVIQEKTVYVPKEVPVVQQQTTLSDNYFKIVLNDKVVSFYEGETNVYKISLRVLDPEIQMKLTAKGLPAGAELKDVSTDKAPNSYELRWKPGFGTISYDEQPPKVYAATLTPVFVSSKNAKKAEIVKGLALDKTVTFSLFRTQQKPAELVLTGLPTEVQEGGAPANFSVTALFPGLDNNSPVKPTIAVTKDNTSQVAGSDLIEMNGIRYISVGEAEYQGDFKWKFNLTFEAKAGEVEAQKTKSGAPANVNFTQTRVAVRVYGAFNASPGSVVRIKIIHAAAPAAPAAPTTTAAAPAAMKINKAGR